MLSRWFEKREIFFCLCTAHMSHQLNDTLHSDLIKTVFIYIHTYSKNISPHSWTMGCHFSMKNCSRKLQVRKSWSSYIIAIMAFQGWTSAATVGGLETAFVSSTVVFHLANTHTDRQEDTCSRRHLSLETRADFGENSEEIPGSQFLAFISSTINSAVSPVGTGNWTGGEFLNTSESDSS